MASALVRVSTTRSIFFARFFVLVQSRAKTQKSPAQLPPNGIFLNRNKKNGCSSPAGEEHPSVKSALEDEPRSGFNTLRVNEESTYEA
jgi:hypothetical protein